MALEDMREEYTTHPLLEESVCSNPIEQFESWFKEAQNNGIFEPNAMTIATAGADGIPSARTVLLKHFDKKGFVFYTNYHSAKAADLHDNPAVCLHFLWNMKFADGAIDRSVRIKGFASKTSRKNSDDYFALRPRGSQIGAWASPQSKILKNGRKQMQEMLQKTQKRFENKDNLPAPNHWGGFCIAPFEIEFWQGAASRMHDRLRYTKEREDKWILQRLAP